LGLGPCFDPEHARDCVPEGQVGSGPIAGSKSCFGGDATCDPSGKVIRVNGNAQPVDPLSALPSICSGGGFGYLGLGGHFGSLSAEALGLISYDSKEGGEHGGILEAGAGGRSLGIESTRTWHGWQEHDSLIGFGGRTQSFQPKGPFKIDNSHHGGLLQWTEGNLNIGGYAGVGSGVRFIGAGIYASVSWNNCN
jgi:hypothetical protein